MRKRNRRRHKLRSLITSKPKHHSLVAGAAGVYAMAMSADCLLMLEIIAQVLESKP